MSGGFLGATINKSVDPQAPSLGAQHQTQLVISPSQDALETRILSTLIQEFGLSQADAAAVVASGLIPMAPVDQEVPEAPQDGNTYGRVNASWGQVLPMAGGDLTGSLGIPAPGIHFPTMTSANANYQFAWSNNRIWPYVNGIAQGGIAYVADITAPPVASTTPPAMDGTASAGTSAAFSAGDHVHPSDTSRLSTGGGTINGALGVTGGDVTVGTNAAGQALTFNGPDAMQPGRAINFMTSGLLRFQLHLGRGTNNSNPETGANGGGILWLDWFNDDGTRGAAPAAVFSRRNLQGAPGSTLELGGDFLVDGNAVFDSTATISITGTGSLLAFAQDGTGLANFSSTGTSGALNLNLVGRGLNVYGNGDVFITGGASGNITISGGATGNTTVNRNPSVALGIATKQYVDNSPPSGGPYLPLVGGTLSNGLSFGATAMAGVSLTRHLTLHTAGIGIGATATQARYVVPTGGVHQFYIGSTMLFDVSATDFSVNVLSFFYANAQIQPGYTLTLGGDPTAPLQAATKQYADTKMSANGVSDGSNAPIGAVGEYLGVQTLSTAAITLTSGTDTAITTLSLTAGDWDVWGSIGYTMTNNNNTQLKAWINPTGATTAPSIDQMGGNLVTPVANNIPQLIQPLTPMRVSIAAPGSVRLGTNVTFTGTIAAWGKLMARRVR